jgi:hypothetical protein
MDPGQLLARLDASPNGAEWEASQGTIVDAATAGVQDPGGVVKTAMRVAVDTTVQALTIGAIVRPRKPEDRSLGQRRRPRVVAGELMVVGNVGMDAALGLIAVDEGPNSLSMYSGGSSGLFVNRCGEGCWNPVEVAGVGALAVVQSGDDEPVILAGVNGGIVRLVHSASDSTAILLNSPPPLGTCLAGWTSGEFGYRLLAGTLEDGVYWSEDRGCTWAPANTGLLDMSVYALVCASGVNGREVALAGTERGCSRA